MSEAPVLAVDTRWSDGHIKADQQFRRRQPDEIPDAVVADSQTAILQEALRVGRGQTMMTGTRAHVVALTQSRQELFEALRIAVAMVDACVHEIETAYGTSQATKTKLAGLQLVLAEQGAM
jgi:hypothetical protein